MNDLLSFVSREKNFFLSFYGFEFDESCQKNKIERSFILMLNFIKSIKFDVFSKIQNKKKSFSIVKTPKVFRRYIWVKKKIQRKSRENICFSACSNGDEKMVELLCQYGADVRLTDRDGHSVVHWITGENRRRLLEKIISVFSLWTRSFVRYSSSFQCAYSYG